VELIPFTSVSTGANMPTAPLAVPPTPFATKKVSVRLYAWYKKSEKVV
jgi:hypothetical protein